jgi:hypothetical protein
MPALVPTRSSGLTQIVSASLGAATRRRWHNMRVLWQALGRLQLGVDAQGFTLGYAGSQVRLRHDGNVDVFTARNFWLQTGGLAQLNPTSPHHDSYTEVGSWCQVEDPLEAGGCAHAE